MKETRKTRGIIVYLGIIGFILIAGFSLSYFFNDIQVVNSFKTQTYNVEIEEEFPGTWGTKKVYIANKELTNAPVVLRVNYNEVWSKEEAGEINTLSNIVNGTSVVTKNFTNAFLNDFILGTDGWYYYKKVLNAGERVQLLDSISLNNTITSSNPEYLAYDYQLIFNYEAIQATSPAVLDIWNKEVTITGGNASWQL